MRAQNAAKMNYEQKNVLQCTCKRACSSRNFLKFSFVEVITREERTNMRQQATTSNEFVAVVTFSRQYILIGSYSQVTFYVACVLLLRVHCRKALTDK